MSATRSSCHSLEKENGTKLALSVRYHGVYVKMSIPVEELENCEI